MSRVRPIIRRFAGCEKGMTALEFVFLAPALLMLVFAIIIYSFYFAAQMGLRHAAAEGARAAVAGLSSAERIGLARTRAQEVIDGYGSLLAAGGQRPVITTTANGSDSFTVRLSYDMSASPIRRYAAFIPLPATTITASTVVTNGSY